MSRKDISGLIRRETELVCSEAAIVLEISGNGKVKEKRNKQGRLSILAIIGPAEKSLQPSIGLPARAVLCEIGLFRSRPYRLERFFQNGRKTYLPARHKFFELSADQYCLVAPRIMSILQDMVNERVATWSRGPTFEVPTPRHYYVRSHNTLYRSYKWLEQPRGLRFSVSVADTYILADIYQAEISYNLMVRRHVSGFSNFIALCLAKYGRSGRSFDRFLQLKGVKILRESLSRNSLPQYLLIKALYSLPGGETYPHFYHLAELIGWDLDRPLAWRRAAQSCVGAKKRLAGIQLKIIREKGGCLIFEIYSELPSKPNASRFASQIAVPESSGEESKPVDHDGDKSHETECPF